MGKEIDRTELGIRLKKLRNERGFTIEQVGEALEMKHNTYGKYERNIAPKPETLIKIAEFFNVSLDYLMGREENADQADNSGEEPTLKNYSDYHTLEEIKDLTEQESLLVSIFRSLDDEDRKKVTRYIKKVGNKK